VSTSDKPARRGRPSTYTPELAHRICERLADGETLRAICRDEGMPDERTVRGWAVDDVEGLSPQYARARQIGYHSLFDQILEIADTPQTGITTKETDKGTETRTGDMIEHRRLQVDARKWMLAKALPKIYGDKLEVDNKHTVVDGSVDIIEVAKDIAFVLNEAAQKLDEQGQAVRQGSAATPTKH
jgi:hypothetical protein